MFAMGRFKAADVSGQAAIARGCWEVWRTRRPKLLETSKEELQAHRAAEVARVTAARKGKAGVNVVDKPDEDVRS